MPVAGAAFRQGRGRRFGKPGGAPVSAAAVPRRPGSLVAGVLLCALLVPACAAARAQAGTDVPTYVGLPVTGQVDDEKVRAARYGAQSTAPSAVQALPGTQAAPAMRTPRQMEPPVPALNPDGAGSAATAPQSDRVPIPPAGQDARAAPRANKR